MMSKSVQLNLGNGARSTLLSDSNVAKYSLQTSRYAAKHLTLT